MVARVEDCFLGKELPGFGGASSHKLLSTWRWSLGQGVREPQGDPLHNGSSFFDASRSGALPTWTSHHHHSSVGGSVGLHMNVQCGRGGGHAALGPGSSVQPQSHDHQNDAGILTSFMSSYPMAQSQAAAAAANTATLAAPGRAGVVTTTALAPGAGLARNSSFESINNTGSCSTPSFCVGSPATVFPSRPSDSGGNHKLSPEEMLQQLPSAAAFSESRVTIHAPQLESQLSDHYLSNDSLSYNGSMEAERDAIVDCVDVDFWTGSGALQLPEFRFEPMLDDTADTGACAGLSFSVGELDSLVSTNHGPRRTTAGLSSISPRAPDFCQSFFAGVDEAEVKPSVIHAPASANKPTHLAIPARGSLLAALNADQPNGARLRWSDEPWMGSTSPQFPNPPSEKSPTSLAGSSPSSPTTPLDPHLFASSKLTGTTGTSSNKRSFAAMQSSSTGGEKPEASSLPLRLQGGGGTSSVASNADKFDVAALSALLYSNTQNNNHETFRSAYSFKDVSGSSPIGTASPAPKQRRRHGTATDPQSIAARTRREKFTDRIRVLQSLVPNGERLDTVHMLSQTFEYVRFLQHKVWDLYNGKDSLSEVKCEKWKEFVDTTTGQVIV